ncbi:hypothetical protein CR513_50366, partial [Mucuna pruriens]
MIMQKDGIINSDNSWTESSSISDLDPSNEYSRNYERDLLMVRRLVSAQCQCCELKLVEKLKHPTLVHSGPYNYNNEGELAVIKQVSLAFTLGKYEDEVLHDVVPMEATHILLGSSW